MIAEEDIERYRSQSEKYRQKMNVRKDFTIEDKVLLDYQGDSEIIFIPEGVKRISHSFMFENRGVKKVYIPSSVELLEGSKDKMMGAFFNCRDLQEVVFAPDSELKDIGDFAFAFCTSLREIHITRKVDGNPHILHGADPSLREKLLVKG